MKSLSQATAMVPPACDDHLLRGQTQAVFHHHTPQLHRAVSEMKIFPHVGNQAIALHAHRRKLCVRGELPMARLAVVDHGLRESWTYLQTLCPRQDRAIDAVQDVILTLR